MYNLVKRVVLKQDDVVLQELENETLIEKADFFDFITELKNSQMSKWNVDWKIVMDWKTDVDKIGRREIYELGSHASLGEYELRKQYVIVDTDYDDYI